MALVPNPNDYPSRHEESKKPISDVSQGEVIVSEPSLVRKFWNIFQLKDLSDIREYILEDLLIPGFKKGIRGVVDIILDGEIRSSSNSRSGGTHYINYNKVNNRREDSEERRSRRGNRDFRLVEFTNKSTAEYVFDEMMSEFNKYGRVPIASFYEFVEKATDGRIKITPYFTDFNYGWTDLKGLSVTGRPGHYKLDLPRAEPLD